MSRLLRISTRNSEFQIIESLKNNRSKRTKLKQGFIEGTESLKQAVSAGCQFTRMIYQKDRTLSDWAKGILESSIVEHVIEMDALLFNELSERSEPSELLATFLYPIREFSTNITRPESVFLLVDRPSDKGNLGSLIRTANSFGVDGVLIFGHGVDPFDSKVIRASLGGVFHTPIYQIQSLDELVQWIAFFRSKFSGLLIGSDSTGENIASNVEYPLPIVLALGNEAKGMSRSIKDLCDFVVKIPGDGNVNSLNVACAGSILLWEIIKAGKGSW